MIENFKYISLLVSIDTIIDIIKMLTDTQSKIIKCLVLNPNTKFTIRGMARKLKKSYALVYNNISKLANMGYIKKEKIPPASILSLTAPKEIIVHAEQDIRDDFLTKHPWVRLMKNDYLKNLGHSFCIMLIFGSYAKGTEKRRSDIDILIIADQPDKAKIAIDDTLTKTKKHSLSFSQSEFLEMIKNPNTFNIGNEALNKHVILHGAEAFVNLR